MYKIEGLYAMQPPIPNPTPWESTRCVKFFENEPMASDRHMMVRPIVENHLAVRGRRIIVVITRGQLMYATP
jgi:hypothetical protein